MAAPVLPTGPSGTAGVDTPAGQDLVVLAELAPEATGLAAYAPLAPGSHVEVTNLSSGRTILLPVAAASAGIRLSPAAAAALGVGTHDGIRVRPAAASPADAAALRNGQSAAARLDAPESVLRALRRQLPAGAAAAPVRKAHGRTVADVAPPPPTLLRIDAPPPSPVAIYPPPGAVPPDVPPTRLVPPAAGTRLMVEVATAADERRARDVARAMAGSASRDDRGWHVRLGPYADLPAAQAARDAALARGYADAAILLADRTHP